MQAFFWAVYGFFRDEEPDFVKGRHHGRLSKLKLRGIYAIDSTTIQLAYWCIDWAKHRQRKAAVKVHMVVKKVPKKELGENIISDEIICLTGQRMSKEYPEELRRVKARVKEGVEGLV